MGTAGGIVELGEPRAAAAGAARRLGLHYLQRYFYLIAFRWVLVGSVGWAGGRSSQD